MAKQAGSHSRREPSCVNEAKRPIFSDLFATLSSVAELGSDQTLLEFGVGKEGFAFFYRETFDRIVAVDINDYSEQYPGIEFVVYTPPAPVPLPGGSFDVVVSHSVLEHVPDLDATLSELDRLVKPGGHLFLTVSPLYYASYGSHLREDGQRLDQWQHLDPGSIHYLTQNPLPGAKTTGHYLNRLTSSAFLGAVGRQPWHIVRYETKFESKPIPSYVDRTVCSYLDLVTRDFRFVGRKVALPPQAAE